MRMIRKDLLLGAGVVLALAGFASVSLADGRHGHGRGHHGGFGYGLFDAYDANGDGRLTQEEINQVRQDRLAEFDQDGNGSLSLEEYQALWMDAMRERMVDRFQSHDDDGDGMVTTEEFTERLDRIVSRLDRDDDGELTMEELRRRDRDRSRDSD